MEAARKLIEEPEEPDSRLSRLNEVERAQGDSEEFDPASPTPERAEYGAQTSLADDPALDTPRVSATFRNNIRFAEHALAAGETYFKVMPDPDEGSFEVETVKAGSFLRGAAHLRDAEQAFIEEHGSTAEESRGAAKAREILGPSHRPVAKQPAQEHERRVQVAHQGRSEMVALEEDVVVRPRGHVSDTAPVRRRDRLRGKIRPLLNH